MAIHLKSLSLFCALLLAAGCADHVMDKEIDQRAERANSEIETAKAPAAEKHRADPLEITDSVWLGSSAIALKRGVPLPAEWEKDNSIAVRSDNPIGLSQIAAIISSQTKIPLRLTGGADQLDSQAGASASGGAAQPGSPAGQAGQSGASASSSGMILSYEGKLSGLLDLVSGYFNVNWTYVNGTLDISRYETRTFVMDALPGSITTAAPQDTGATEGASSGVAAELLATPTIDMWADINQTLRDIVGSEGTITSSQSSGTVVVSTTTDRMEKVASFLQEENKRLSRQVAVSVELFTVSISDEQAYAFDLQPQINTGGWFGRWLNTSVGGVPITASDIAGGSLSVNLVNPPALNGSSAVFQALNTLGKATRVAQIPITTLNNRPASQKISTDRAYIAETAVTTDPNSGATTTELTTAMNSSGISVSVLPRLMTDGRMLLQYALAQGALVRLRDFTSPDGNSSVQLPETQGLSFSQQVMMKSGSSLVLAGFDQSDAENTQSSPLRGLSLLLGGTKGNTQKRQLVVITITPREIEVSNPEAS